MTQTEYVLTFYVGFFPIDLLAESDLPFCNHRTLTSNLEIFSPWICIHEYKVWFLIKTKENVLSYAYFSPHVPRRDKHINCRELDMESDIKRGHTWGKNIFPSCSIRFKYTLSSLIIMSLGCLDKYLFLLVNLFPALLDSLYVLSGNLTLLPS